MSPSFADLVARLPKAELHVHLVGAVPESALTRLAERHPPDRVWASLTDGQREWLEGHVPCLARLARAGGPPWPVSELFGFEDFAGFIACYGFASRMVATREDLVVLARGVVEDLARQGVAYVEVTLSLPEHLRRGLSVDDASAAFDAVEEVPGIRVQWLVDFVRDYGPEEAERVARLLRSWGDPRVVGVNLGGSEPDHPARLFRRAFDVARDAGLRVTAHAGEAAGPASIREAVDLLGAERVGHGVTAVQDPELVAELARRRVVLEVSPTSNLLTRVVASVEAHPLPRLLRAGVPVTLNTDDPTFFRTSLCAEASLALRTGLAEGEVLALLRAGFEHAFLPEAERRRLLERFDAAVRAAAAPAGT